MNFSEVSAKQLDELDPLRQFRHEFYLRDSVIYLDGNSLGVASKAAEQALLSCFEDWKRYGIDGWTQGERPWFFAAETIGKMLAPIVGAKPSEVIATGSISVNIHQGLASFFRPDAKRNKILADSLNFPTDIYAIKSQLKLHGLDERYLVQVASSDGYTLNEDDIIAAMDDDIALMMLPSVLYCSGQLLNIERLTSEAHKRGIIVGWDLAHSVGSVPHRLHEWNVDFAVWCNYKYVNGGPGAVGGMFIHERHFGREPGLAGWFSSDKTKQFDMEHHLIAANNAGAYQIGTTNMLSLAPLYGALSLFEKTTMAAIRSKSSKQTDYLIYCIERDLFEFGFKIVTPRSLEKRGGHISIYHSDAARITKAMKNAGVIPDYRHPGIIRLAPIAFYTSYCDIENAVKRIRDIMETRSFENCKNARDIVA